MPDFYLLTEEGDYLLQENGDRIILEAGNSATTSAGPSLRFAGDELGLRSTEDLQPDARTAETEVPELRDTLEV
jgi:hypothetical protein